MGGVHQIDQNISAYMINLRTKKWWRQLFPFAVDVAVDDAYLIYCLSHLNSGDYRLSALGFHQAIVDAYYPLYRKGLPSTTLFISGRSLYHPANNLQFDGINHGIDKGSQ